MTTAEVREAFLQFFAQRGHSIVQSSSLVPGDDPTLLFTNAGMVQFKDCFLGTDKRAYVRATTCQKCLRISGKHNDLENVGRTARHHTFFEMLGNFSFGNYFKEDAIKFAWEFLTEDLKLPRDRLWVTVYKEDDEAAELWQRCTDVLDGRILRFGKEDNFWAMGETGPCGPCSEIHYYLGNNVAGQSEEEFRRGDGTYIEIWNLVFMQFNRDPSGQMSPLPKPSVDTGMGLERISAVKQGVLANFDTDLFRSLIRTTEDLSEKRYDGRDYRERDPEKDRQYAIDVAMRVIADHIRAVAFLLADGVNPSSDGRGYVMRRLIRRACRHGRVLGFREPFMARIAARAVELMGDAYPELRASEEKIRKVVTAEEEKFLRTLDSGLTILQREVEEVRKRSARSFPGEIAFLLHDTYGFPLDLTEDLLRRDDLMIDREEFSRQMELQRERSRAARASEVELMLRRAVKPLATKFVGYDYLEYESSVRAIFGRDGELPSAGEGAEIALLVEETPFYGESGGQIGDTGRISTNSASLDVIDTQKVGGDTYVHVCRVIDGAIAPGERARLEVEAERRRRLRANHSATHLLHLALRDVLGSHIKQAGSRVSDQALRFDFTHFDALSAAELAEIESRVNESIRDNDDVATEVLPIEEAKRSGAVALFGEKYGEMVRVVQIGPRSREFCGGTHVRRSGDIGVMGIVSEGSISAGVRRIEARAGYGAYQNFVETRRVMSELASLLRTGEHELVSRVTRLLEHGRQLEREMQRVGQQSKSTAGSSLAEKVRVHRDGTKVIAEVVEHASPKMLREVADELKQKLGSGCIALASVADGKAILLTAVTDDLVERYHAGKLIGELSQIVGGQGGGRADLAQAGGGDPEKLGLALKRFEELVG